MLGLLQLNCERLEREGNEIRPQAVNIRMKDKFAWNEEVSRSSQLSKCSRKGSVELTFLTDGVLVDELYLVEYVVCRAVDPRAGKRSLHFLCFKCHFLR